MSEHLWWIVGAFCLTWAVILWTWCLLSDKASSSASRPLDRRVMEIEKRLGIEPDNCVQGLDSSHAIAEFHEAICPPPAAPGLVELVTAPSVITIGIDGRLMDRLNAIESRAVDAFNAALEAKEYARDAATESAAIRSVMEGMKKPACKPAKKRGRDGSR